MKNDDRGSIRTRIVESLHSAANTGTTALLAVEDDADTREALTAVLGPRYEVIGLGSGRRLLEMIEAYKPALIILDVNLPGMDGFELCRLIRSCPRHRRLPVLFLTARKDDESFVRSIQENADAYLTKPFEARELKETVARLLGDGGRESRARIAG